MVLRSSSVRRRVMRLGAMVSAGAMVFGVFQGCDDKLVNFSRYIDPCGTILADCDPGSIEVNAAAVGDYCVDPLCPIPGQCNGNAGAVGGAAANPALGTITDLCP